MIKRVNKIDSIVEGLNKTRVDEAVDGKVYKTSYGLKFTVTDKNTFKGPDKSTADILLDNYGIIFLDSYGAPIDNEDDWEEMNKVYKKSIKEETEVVEGKEDITPVNRWMVLLVSGGSIGGKNFPVYFDSKEEAVKVAKARNGYLSPGEKKYYRMKYGAVEDTEQNRIKYLVAEEE